jgi:hypothetical protein
VFASGVDFDNTYLQLGKLAEFGMDATKMEASVLFFVLCTLVFGFGPWASALES